MDPVRHLTLDDLLSVKPVHGNLSIRRHDDTIRFFNLLRGKDVLRTAGAPCLHLNEASLRLRRLLKPFRRHIGMRDTRRAGGNGKDLHLVRPGISHVREPLIHALLLFIRPVNDLQKFLRRPGITQTLGKFRIHQHHRQLAQHIQMHVILRVRRRDQEEQSCRFLIQRFKIHTVLHHHCRKPGTVDCIPLSMRDGDALSDPCGTLFLSCIHQLTIAFHIIDLAASYHEIYYHIQRFLLRLRRRIK